MSGTSVRNDGSSVVSMLDQMMQVEDGGGGLPPGTQNGKMTLQDGRQVTIEQEKSGGSLGRLLDLIRDRASHEVNERIIRNMGVHGGGKPVLREQPVSREMVARLREATIEAFEQRNLEVIDRFLGEDPRRTLLDEAGRIDPQLVQELEEFNAEMDVFLELFKQELQEEAKRCARRGEEMREDQARAAAERLLQDQRRLKRAPLTSKVQLARAIQHWGQQKGKGREPLRESVQRIVVEVRDGGPAFQRVCDMVQQSVDTKSLKPPYTSDVIARHMLDDLEKELRDGAKI